MRRSLPRAWTPCMSLAAPRADCYLRRMSETNSKAKNIASWILRGLVGLGLLASASMKLSGAAQIVENFEKMHLTPYLTIIALIEMTSAILLLIPRTSSLGTLLVTGYLGGALVAHLTSATPGDIAPAIILGLLAWSGNFLRNPTMFQSFKG